MKQHRVLIVDDHPIVRHGLRELLAEEPDLAVCGEASDLPEALQQVDETNPDAIIVDLTLPSGNGLELIQQVTGKNKRIKILVSTMHDELLYADRAVRCGASGYINKLESPENIVAALRRVLRGEMVLRSRIASGILHGLQHGQSQDLMNSLTNRELEVFEMIGAALPTKRIAGRLGVSRKTIEAHRENIKAKLNLKNALELYRLAAHWNLKQH